MTKAKCLRLRHKDRAHVLGQGALHQGEQFVLALLLQFRFQLVGLVEVIGNGVLVAVGNEDQGVRASVYGLVHCILNQRAIQHRQHFLGDHLGGRQETRAQTSHRENYLAQRLAHLLLS